MVLGRGDWAVRGCDVWVWGGGGGDEGGDVPVEPGVGEGGREGGRQGRQGVQVGREGGREGGRDAQGYMYKIKKRCGINFLLLLWGREGLFKLTFTLGW